jgi:ornithine cyclodeaminase/alanine dehydrogenase-like protein (mu-crystallin family)
LIVIGPKQARELVSTGALIPVMRDAMAAYSSGKVTQPLRTVVRPPSTPDLIASMPCHIEDGTGGGFGIKTILLKHDNAERGLDPHQGAVLIFDPVTGAPQSLIDATVLTALRTAAVSAVATDALAGPEAGDLAVLGAGTQARSHLQAMAAVRDLRRVRIWNRTPGRAEQLARWFSGQVDAEVRVCESVAQATAGADLICTTLACTDPVVEARDLAPGAHVNAVGSSFPSRRELSSAAVARCRVFVDSRESAWAEAGDLLVPRDEGVIDTTHVLAELGEVLLGRHPGRADHDEITLYKSLGLAVQDVAAAFEVSRLAAERGVGDTVAWD